ncbi:MAG: A/G-specific adenine glycosylase [Gemmatimonadetes bacterium]|nr:A/G-specific adenine glycosylase [Gemmatimonadota bacterium]|tara:strand:- start:232 stop:1353 length:1122 start_codon:yes stop_codon:yes gene_type:complete
MIPSEDRTAFRRRILRWYDRQKRDMPWRGSQNPYHILLSEFMLQQTQVATVIPYFERFTHALPTLADLARADLDDVLRLWEGLGYYNRARNLHKAARAIIDDHDGHVPDDFDQLLSLPGFGPYTSAAVASIAFSRPHAVLDGNVIRVLSRLGAIDDDVTAPATKKAHQQHADDLLTVGRPGDHNQAMMELGATVCKPRQPLCDACPVAGHCAALSLGRVDEIPRKAKRAARPERHYGALIVRKGDEFLISRRKADGLLGGLWEFPSIETKSPATIDALTPRVLEALGCDVDALKPHRLLRHAYTHFSAVVRSYRTSWRSGRPSTEDHDQHKWVRLDEIETYAYSRIARKLVDSLTDLPDYDQLSINLAPSAGE